MSVALPRAAACAIAAVACALAAAAPAAANLLPLKSLTLPVRVPSMNNWSAGTSTMTVTYTDTTATADVAAPAVQLGAGKALRVMTCVKAYAAKRAFDSKCDARLVSTIGNLGAVAVAAPSVRLTAARQTQSGAAWFSYVVSVGERQANGTYKEIATSWPTGGLSKGHVVIPAQSATKAPVPTSLGAALSTGLHGGVNTGQIDSFCGDAVLPASAPAGDVSTDGLGAGAPAYYEIGEPTGAYAGQAPKGVMLVIHGGGWYSTGAGHVARMRPDADRWRARGWRTLSVTYRGCRASLSDVQWFYDRAVESWGDQLPYCALGSSAGGHLALMLAASRQTLDCAVDQAGPTNAESLPSQRVEAATAAAAADGPRWVHNLMVAAVGPDELLWWSPARFPARMTAARILFASPQNDWAVPYAQGVELRDNVKAVDPAAYVDLYRLPAGSIPWVHGGVSSDGVAEYERREEQLVAPLVN